MKLVLAALLCFTACGGAPAATLDIRGGGEVRLQNGAPLLVNGRVGIVTNRPVEIPMSDDSSLRLGNGEYVIAAEMLPSDPFQLLQNEGKSL